MFNRLFTAVALTAAIAFSASAAPAASTSTASAVSDAPTLFNLRTGVHTLARGAQKAVPVSVSEDQAFNAIFKGGMWLPNASGGREYAKYDHHLIHDNGDWTWVGKVQTTHGLQSVVITFGKDAVFGRIPQPSGHALRLVTAGGQKLLVQTDGGKMAALPENVQLHARQDFKIPPRHKAAANSTARTTTSAAAQTLASAATTSGGPTIDVMVAYTPGFVSEQGSDAAALTRINNLVDITNQAYADSGVSQRIRLVHSMQVSYTDTNDNATALDDITGNDGNGNSVPIPSSLQGVASARTQYGADLVVLLRHFNNAGNNGCGIGWLIGGGEQQIIPSEDNAFGYSVVQDGSDSGFFCLDSTFAHELGHNMGSAHDRAHADQPGAYSYSYGYVGNGTNGFATIMAYGSDTQTPLDLFSNPDVSKCQNSPCGVADTSSSSADNVHSLNNTASLIAQFEATKVGGTHTPYDFNGDGKSDLFWQDGSRLSYWLMNGASRTASQISSLPAGTRFLAKGDFNGDGKADILWNVSGNIWLWSSTGSGFVSTEVRAYPTGWTLIAAGDMDGDGNTDLFWRDATGTSVSHWIMNGSTLVTSATTPVSATWKFLAAGDFDGDGKTDLLWQAGSEIELWKSSGSSFTSENVRSYPGGAWKVVGAADLDGDGKTDLIWQDVSTNRVSCWIMSGTTLSRSWILSVQSYWHLGATGDFDGDGKQDLVWASNAGVVLWTNVSPTVVGKTIDRYPPGWTLLGPD